MVSAMHTIFVNLFTSAPSVLFALAPELPSDDAVTLLSEDYTQYPPAEYRADAVLSPGSCFLQEEERSFRNGEGAARGISGVQPRESGP